jgi:hypothetical protein
MSRNMTIVPMAAYIEAQHHTAATTITGDAVDVFASDVCAGYPGRYAVVLCTGTINDGSVTIRLEHSDDGETWETAKGQFGDTSVVLDGTTPRRHTNALGIKRYIRLVAAVSEGTEATDVAFSATASLDMGALSL